MYKFIDTTESQGGGALPSEALAVNGKYIENEISGYRTLQVEGRELLNSEISEMQIGNNNGARYQGKRDTSRAITITYELQAKTPEQFRERFNKLSGILDQEEATLLFRDEPDKCFTGTKSTIDSVPPGQLNVVSQFTFYCADPYKYSTINRSAKNNGGRMITLTNDGTKPTPINVKATMKSDNGYLGFTLADRFYQAGNPEEVDGEHYESTVMLFDDHMTENRGWVLNQGVTPPVTTVRDEVGTVRYVVEVPGEGVKGEGYVEPSAYSTGSSWHGPSLTKTVPADKNGAYPVNWKVEYRFDFNTVGAGSAAGAQVGHTSMTMSDQNGDIICSVVFEDNNASLERSDMVVYIGNKRTWDTKNTTNFYVTGRGDSGPLVAVEKLGNQITVKFTHAGINRTFFTNSPNAQLRKITWYAAAYQTRANIRNNVLRAINVRKHNVQNYRDIPNYFAERDTVELVGNTNELYINNLLNWDAVDIGSQPLLLPPGTHTLGIITSDWAETPDVEVTWKERYL